MKTRRCPDLLRGESRRVRRHWLVDLVEDVRAEEGRILVEFFLNESGVLLVVEDDHVLADVGGLERGALQNDVEGDLFLRKFFHL
jgi:hypothetical protein